MQEKGTPTVVDTLEAVEQTLDNPAPATQLSTAYDVRRHGHRLGEGRLLDRERHHGRRPNTADRACGDTARASQVDGLSVNGRTPGSGQS
jgi:hypothetical protein